MQRRRTAPRNTYVMEISGRLARPLRGSETTGMVEMKCSGSGTAAGL